ncbi:MAG TPA: hypothetical protein VHC19_14495 [Pirellulales bacterium]|jgi:hypothetical protein|nr:hypothetical protein [Pirellulales bacterium]
MNRRSLIRKLTYLSLIVILLLPLSYYSQPATVAVGNEKARAGGRLAQLRDQFQLGQANLGEIDPAGETIKLATLGLRGVAANILWEKANEAKKTEDWTGLQATLDQLAKLQPNYISVWRFQAWNVSYNISVEWDDYHDRYFWVKEGIKFLRRGSRYNQMEPRLVFDTGWFTGNKIGVADERVQFRRLFREDDDPEFPNHRSRPQNRRDNWLVGQEFFEQAVSLVDDRGASIRSMNPLTFFNQPGMSQINYAHGLEEDGTFEEKAKVAWQEANRRWTDFGNRELNTTDGFTIRLNDLDLTRGKVQDAVAKLDALAPEARNKIREEKKAKLPEADRKVLATPVETRSMQEARQAYDAEMKLFVTHQEVADRVKGEKADEAKKLAEEILYLDGMARAIDRDRGTINFTYWQTRCRMEETDSALEGRRLLYQAKQLYDDAALPEAREAYERGFAEWRKTFKAFPDMIEDGIGSDDLVDSIKGYAETLKKLDEPFPEDFILKDVLVGYRKRNPATPLPGMPAPDIQPPPTPGH